VHPHERKKDCGREDDVMQLGLGLQTGHTRVPGARGRVNMDFRAGRETATAGAGTGAQCCCLREGAGLH
jgi:hypothetical protein